MQVRHRAISVLSALAVLAGILAVISLPDSPADAVTTDAGDGIVVYGETANATPRLRTYGASGNSFGAETGAAAGATGVTFVTRTSPFKQEAISGYVDSGGTLRVMCYDGTSWTQDWSVSVGGTGTTRRFDIAYESNTGDAVVLYSTNTATSNELAYRTHPASSGCNSGWVGPTNLTSGQTNGIVHWVKMAWDRRGSSDLITALWADASSDLSASIWGGSSWSNEPTAPLETALDIASGAQDVDNFDVEYESVSGDVMVMWGRSVAANVNGAYYNTCTGGMQACTWGTATSWNATGDRAQQLDISANPVSNEIVFASNGYDGATDGELQTGYWSGTVWTNSANKDTTATSPAAGYSQVKTGWLISGANTRSIVVYADSTATATSISIYAGNAGTFTAESDFAGAPVPGAFRWFDIQNDPRNTDRLMLTYSDANSDLFAKRMIMSGTTITPSNSDASAALEASLSQATAGAFSFAYWRNPTGLTQNNYRWYQNANAVQPTTDFELENTPAAINSSATAARLRANMTASNTNMPASSEAFDLQYSTSTSGPWTDVARPGGGWCNTVTPACNTNWLSRKKITIDNSASAGALAYFPLRVALTSANITWAEVKDAGEDIRFVDPDGTALNYEIENWNEPGTSNVWVEVPSIDAGSVTDYIWMYYNNTAATDAQNAGAVWDNNSSVMVWHLNESAGQHQDSTTNNLDATTTSPEVQGTAAGKIGGADDFERTGGPDYVQRTHNNLLNLTSTWTLGMWINPESISSAGTYDTLLSKDVSAGVPTFWMELTESNRAVAGVSNGSGYPFAMSPVGSITTGSLQYLAATFDNSADIIRLYLNGVEVATGAAAINPSTGTGAFRIGASTSGTDRFDGVIDDTRISSVVRSADWIEAEYLQGTNAMSSFGAKEGQSAWMYKDNATPADGAAITGNLLTGSDVFGRYAENNPTATNPNAVAVGQDVEYDFSLDPANAVANTTYYFRIGRSTGVDLNAYTNYPALFYGSSLTQNSYRWYQNTNAVQPTTDMAAENTAASITSSASVARLRQNVTVSSLALGASKQSFKLQYSNSTGGPWTDVGATAWCNTATPDCNTNWLSRRKISMNNAASAVNLTNFPLRVALSASNIEYAKTQDLGQDIRFVDSDGTALNYEIENWNESGESNVWVKVPQVDATSTTDYIWLYYNNATASDAQSATNVWDSNYRGVWHMEETTGTTMSDSAGTAQDATKRTATEPNPVAGRVSGSQDFDGSNDYARSAAIDLTASNVVTASMWLNWDAYANNDDLALELSPDTGANNGGFYVDPNWSPTGRFGFSLQEGGLGFREETIPRPSAGVFHHYAVVYDNSTAAGDITVYVDGVATATNIETNSKGAAGDFGNYQLHFMNRNLTTLFGAGLQDEVRLSNGARSADWVEAEYLQGQNTMATYGSEESVNLWSYYNNLTPADGTAVSANLLTGSDIAGRYTESSPTGVNPNSVAIGQDMEWDFALDPSVAPAGTYYFRLTRSDGIELETYTNYPTMTVNSGTNQAAYRFFGNTNTPDVGGALAAQDTAATAPAQGTAFRLRTLVDITNFAYGTSAPALKLQVATRSGTCDAAFSGETYADVAAGSGAIRYYDNASPSDGAAATSNVDDPTYSGHTKVMQGYEESNNASVLTQIPVGQFGEWDFSLVDFSAVAGTAYCFRLVESGGTLLDTYTTIPQITTVVTNQAPNVPSDLVQTKTDTTPIPATSHYNFDASTQSWTSTGTATLESTIKRTGAGSIRSAVGAGSTTATFDSPSSTQNLTAGGPVFTAWVYVPSSVTGAVGGNLFVNNTAGVPTNGPYVTFTKDAWTMVSATLTAEALTDVYKIGVWIDTLPSAGTKYIYLDDVQQGTGIWTPETSVRFAATASDQDSSGTLSLCVEVKAVTVAFDASGVVCGSGVAYSGTPVTVTHTVSGLSDGTQYHWRALVRDAGPLDSAWVAYGGNKDTTTASADFGIDATAPTAGTVKDGPTQGVDVNYNTGALDTLSGNWTGFSDGSSGLARYEYSIGTSAGDTTTSGGWIATGLTEVTKTGLSLRTGQMYYFNVRAVDVAGNSVAYVSSNGQMVAPTLTFTISATSVQFANLNIGNSYSDDESFTVTTASNAYGGAVVRAYQAANFASGTPTISGFNGGTYASPDTWQTADRGFGYTSSDTSVQGSNKFQQATCPGGTAIAAPGCFAPFPTTGPGDIIADHAAGVVGSPFNDVYTITLRVKTNANQAAGRYSTTLRLSGTATY